MEALGPADARMCQPSDYDLAGFCLGVVERKSVIDGRAIAAGILPRKHGGSDNLDNLALASIADHFQWQGSMIVGKTAIGRTTAWPTCVAVAKVSPRADDENVLELARRQQRYPSAVRRELPRDAVQLVSVRADDRLGRFAVVPSGRIRLSAKKVIT